MNRYISEFIGTFTLVFAGTGAIVANSLSNGRVTHVGIALSFGLAIMVMIYAVGDISGAHFNPAVSFGFWSAGRLPAREMVSYMISQCLAAVVAAGLLRLLFPEESPLTVTEPALAVTGFQAFIYEMILTFFLMFVIINVATGAKEKGLFAGTAIGGTIIMDALFGGPITGASMNPARSIGPALVNGNLTGLWLYIAAPLAGAFLAVVAYRGVTGEAGGKP